jgi:aarF domain-containing kinase
MTCSQKTVVCSLRSVSLIIIGIPRLESKPFILGQAIGANAGLMPKAMQLKFSKLFDDAPQIPYSTVHSVLESEFGRPPAGPNGVFEVFEEQAVASASIAQVHRAKLPDGGGWVAVKVQV